LTDRSFLKAMDMPTESCKQNYPPQQNCDLADVVGGSWREIEDVGGFFDFVQQVHLAIGLPEIVSPQVLMLTLKTQRRLAEERTEVLKVQAIKQLEAEGGR
jgi:hypothetical protein